MRSTPRPRWLWVAIAVVVLISFPQSRSQESSPAFSAPTTTQRARKAEFQQYLVNLADDVAHWKGNLQGINPRKVCSHRSAAAAIDENIAGITKSLNALQAKIQMLAQQETLGGDIELLAGLQAIASDATRLESLLPCALARVTTPRGPVASGVVAAWSEQLQKVRQQVAERAAKLQALLLALARNPSLLSDEDRTQWSFKDFVELVKTLAWPLAFALALALFRRPLSRFLEQIAGKITKLSVFEVAIELATVPSAPTPWLDPGVFAGTELFGGAVTTTTIMDLFKRIRDDTVWNYLIVDLEDGRHLLESRLYLFTTILQQMGRLRCVIFVETHQGYFGRFLGIARPDDVRRALGEKYTRFRPLFLKSFSNALWETFQCKQEAAVALDGPLSKDLAEAISGKFIFDPDMQVTQDPQNPEWSKLEPANAWDHSHWLTIERFNKDLRSVLFDFDLSQLADTPETPVDERTRALLRRQVPFVAMVNRQGEFKRLVDRQVLIEQVAAKLGAEPTA